MFRWVLYIGVGLLLLLRVASAFGSEPSQEPFVDAALKSQEDFPLHGLLQWKEELTVLVEDKTVSHSKASDNELYLKLKLLEDRLLIRRRVDKAMDWEILYELVREYDESNPLHWYVLYYHGLHLFASGQFKSAEVLLEKAYHWSSVYPNFGYQRSSLLALYEVNMCANQSSEAVHYFRLFYEVSERHRNSKSVERAVDSTKVLVNASSAEMSQYIWWWLTVILFFGILLWYAWSKYRLVLVPVGNLSRERTSTVPFNNQVNATFSKSTRASDDALTDEEIIVDEQKVELLAELRSKKILTEDDWLVFERLFVQIHPEFLVHLRFRHKQISPSEEKLACLIRLHFSTKEIARLLAVSTHAVNVGRYRLRKRFALEGNLRLEEYLMGF